MEVSSHALSLGRVDGVRLRRRRLHQPQPGPPRLPRLDGGVRGGQGVAVHRPSGPRRAVVNVDDAAGRRIAAATGVPVTTYRRGRRLARPRGRPAPRRQPLPAASGPGVDVPRRACGCPGPSTSPTPSARSPPSSTSGVPVEAAVAGVAALPGVPGRMERVDAGQPFLAVVDYAHTPDAVAHAARAPCAPSRPAGSSWCSAAAATATAASARSWAAPPPRAPTSPCSPATTRAARTRCAILAEMAAGAPGRAARGRPARGHRRAPCRWPARATPSSSPARATRPARRSPASSRRSTTAHVLREALQRVRA